MALPKLNTPSYEMELPSGGKVKYRPFTVGEQKNLLIIAEGGKPEDILNGILELVDACTFNKVDWLKKPTVDFEWAFLNIRGKSVGEVVEMTYRCLHEDNEGNKCGHKNEIAVDVRTAVPKDFKDPKIQINDDVTIIFEPLLEVDSKDILAGVPVEDIIHRRTKMVVNGDEVITEFSKEELKQFLDTVPPLPAQKITEYFNEQPTLVLKHPTKCKKCGFESEVVLEGVLNFFG